MKQIFEKLLQRKEDTEIVLEKQLKVYPYIVSVRRTYHTDGRHDYLTISTKDLISENRFWLFGTPKQLKELAHAILEVVYEK